MQRRRCRDRHTDDLVVAQYRVDSGDWSVIAIGKRGRCGAGRVADRRQRAKLGEVPHEVFPPIAATDRGHLHRALCGPAGHHNVVYQMRSPMLPQSG